MSRARGWTRAEARALHELGRRTYGREREAWWEGWLVGVAVGLALALVLYHLGRGGL